MTRLKKIIFIGVPAVILIGIMYGVYLYNKPHRNIAKEKPAFTLEAAQLIREFEENEAAFNKMYVDQVVQVTGNITSISKSPSGIITITLEDEMSGVTCTFDSLTVINQAESLGLLNTEQQTTIKGRCDGALMDVKLSKCVVCK